MPVKNITPQVEINPEMVKELARVIKANKPDGPPDEPVILLEKLRHSNNTHVTVIWDQWKAIDPEERGRIILDAIAQSRGEDEMLRVSMALGITKDEAARLGIS